jgi:serine/threonine protein phosphatase PrpC
MKTHIFTNTQMAEPQFFQAAGGLAGVFSIRAPDPDRDRNEDGAAMFMIDDRRAVFAVADGVGGHRGADVAASTAMRELETAIEGGLAEEKDLRACIMDGFENANRAVVEAGTGAASTLAVAEIDSHTVRPYHAGDSVILSVGLRGKMRVQTVPHSPVGYAVESGVIDEDEAMNHDDRHVVSNVIGAADMRIEVGASVNMARRDTVLLASDGLTDNLQTEEIVEMIRKGPLKSVAKRLAAEAIRRMTEPLAGRPSKPDDLTFLLFRRTK